MGNPPPPTTRQRPGHGCGPEGFLAWHPTNNSRCEGYPVQPTCLKKGQLGRYGALPTSNTPLPSGAGLYGELRPRFFFSMEGGQPPHVKAPAKGKGKDKGKATPSPASSNAPTVHEPVCPICDWSYPPWAQRTCTHCHRTYCVSCVYGHQERCTSAPPEGGG